MKQNIKQTVYLLLAVILVASCHAEPFPQDRDGEFLVYTSPEDDVDFTKYSTYHISDSLQIVGKHGQPEYSTSASALILIGQYKQNMNEMGFTFVEDASKADVQVRLTYTARKVPYMPFSSSRTLVGELMQGNEVLWTSYIGGPSGPYAEYDVMRLQNAIDQAFEQSSYLKLDK